MAIPNFYPRLPLKGIRFESPRVVPIPQRNCTICGSTMIWILFESRWRCPRCGNIEVPRNLKM